MKTDGKRCPVCHARLDKGFCKRCHLEKMELREGTANLPREPR